MKKIVAISFVSLFLLLTCSCSKSQTTTTNSALTMTYKGATHSYGVIYGLVAVTSSNSISMSASEAGTGSSFVLTEVGSANGGTYSYNSGNEIQISLNSAVYSTTNPNGGFSSGNIVITESGNSCTLNISGTFYNVNDATDNFTFTGSFSGLLHKS